MSFTGSRGSFLGDSHFYGKQVSLRVVRKICSTIRGGKGVGVLGVMPEHGQLEDCLLQPGQESKQVELSSFLI